MIYAKDSKAGKMQQRHHILTDVFLLILELYKSFLQCSYFYVLGIFFSSFKLLLGGFLIFSTLN